MVKHEHVQQAKHYETGQYEQQNPSYDAGYSDGKKAGIEYAKAVLKELHSSFERRGLYGASLVADAIGKLK